MLDVNTQLYRSTTKLYQFCKVYASINTHSYVELFFSQLEETFELDPMVLQAFVYICPEAGLCALFEKILPHVSIAWLLYVIGDLIQQGILRENVSHCYIQK